MDFVYFLFSSRLHAELMGFRFSVCFLLLLFAFCFRSFFAFVFAPPAVLGLGAGFLFANSLFYKSLQAFFELSIKCYGFCNTPTEKPPQRTDIEPCTPSSSGWWLDSNPRKQKKSVSRANRFRKGGGAAAECVTARVRSQSWF